MKSMTGFGSGEAPLGPGRVVLDARTVNHRYLDVRVRMPPELSEHGPFLEQRARERLSRGRCDLAVRFEGAEPAPKLDVGRARTAFRELEALRDELSPGAEVPFTALLALPSLFVVPPGFDSRDAESALTRALEQAVLQLEEMRTREGSTLTAELRARLEACRKLHGELGARARGAVLAHEARLRSRITRLVSEVGIALEPGRVETEIALLAERMDVTEELVRLESHYRQLEALLSADGPAGRRLDFLLQEIARETNTVGAKCQDAELGRLVVEMKSEIERMREQVQNVE